MFPSTILLGVLALTGQATAHMIMDKPVPYDKSNINNSPLMGDGSDFPCKQGPGVYKVETMNTMAVGEEQTLAFRGSAVHAGGSCQLSLSPDKEPSKSSKFKVILSIEGGCPGVGSPSTFPFKIPAEVPSGDYALAWTWFNKIGNREMYMNCAPVTVTGSSASPADFDKLPDMAVANIAGQGTCKTAETFDYVFENPGKYVVKGGSGPFAPLCGSGSGAPVAPPTQPSGMPSMPGMAPSPSSSMNNGIPSQTPTTTLPYQPPVPAVPQSSPTSMVSSAAPAVPTLPDSTQTQTSTTFITVTGTAPVSSIPEPSSPPSLGNTQCSPDGAILCNGPNQFGICNHGSVVWQQVAAGTKCQNGVIARRNRVY